MRESRSSWRDFLLALKARGLVGVEFVVSDDHPGLKAAIREVLPEAAWQRCYVHFLRNALDYVPRKVDDDCLRELRWFYDRRDLAEVRRDIAAWLAKWQAKYPAAVQLGRGQHRGDAELLPAALAAPQTHEVDQHARTLEPGAEAPHPCRAHLSNAESCLRLVRALAVEMRRLARSDALSQHGASEGIQERGPAGLGRLTAAGRGRRCATRGLRAAHALHHQPAFAELDAHDSRLIDQQGWTYLHAYSDRAISGATILRPAYQALLEDARRGQFDIVVAEALDRLSRDQEDIAGIVEAASVRRRTGFSLRLKPRSENCMSGSRAR